MAIPRVGLGHTGARHMQCTVCGLLCTGWDEVTRKWACLFRKEVASQILLGMVDPLLLIVSISRELRCQAVCVTFLSLIALSRPVRRPAGCVFSDACHFPMPGTCFIQHLLICLVSVLELFLLLVVKVEKLAAL